nr:hypothetical protein [uncultured Nostoc sp.]
MKDSDPDVRQNADSGLKRITYYIKIDQLGQRGCDRTSPQVIEYKRRSHSSPTV